MKHIMEKSDIEYLENLERLSQEYFGFISFQTLKFFMIETQDAIPNSNEYNRWENIVSKYLIWQSEYEPTDLLLWFWNKYSFNHDNDLTWNQCEKVCTKYHSFCQKKYGVEKEKLSKEAAFAINNISKNEQDFIDSEKLRIQSILEEYGIIDNEQ